MNGVRSSPVGSWAVTAVERDGRLSASLDGTSPSIDFDGEGRAHGSTGCNRFTAGYEIDGDVLRIAGAAATRMFCTEPPRVMEQEAALLDALGRARRFRRDEATLELYDGAGSVVVAARLNG
jgi:heat shock protein HslJ